ncbi:hypothetical protein B4U80_14462 [Leptotrombidium deliense]|uniref:Caspase family p20 domain-containing protein n=1 Tax=Leptotrombidium deliense TaxID=299467 RepID=A0A443RVS6_9ACAR|nr:hypothetical protein B4U80_14462 [Leptotrombidium deliense]
MCQCLVEIAVDEKLEQHEALIVIIISKSESINNVDVIYGTDGGYFTLNNLKMLFSDESCKALKNKLKMFIIDGPRGDKIFDFRNEKEEKACENLKSLFDTSKLIKGNEDEPSNIHMITPYGSLLAGKNFHLSSGENHEYYVERIVENGMKKYNIQQFQDGLHDFICPIIFNDLAQYAGNLSFWEKTNNDSTNSFPGETLLHQFRQSKCRYPVLQNCDGASCFCGI